jgi:hypothetical protein
MRQRRYSSSDHEAICLWYFQSLPENDIVARLGICSRRLRRLIREIKPDKKSLMRQQAGSRKDGKSAARLAEPSGDPDAGEFEA